LCAVGLPGWLARLACPVGLPGWLARLACPVGLPGWLARLLLLAEAGECDGYDEEDGQACGSWIERSHGNHLAECGPLLVMSSKIDWAARSRCCALRDGRRLRSFTNSGICRTTARRSGRVRS